MSKNPNIKDDYVSPFDVIDKHFEDRVLKHDEPEKDPHSHTSPFIVAILASAAVVAITVALTPIDHLHVLFPTFFENISIIGSFTH